MLICFYSPQGPWPHHGMSSHFSQVLGRTPFRAPWSPELSTKWVWALGWLFVSAQPWAGGVHGMEWYGALESGKDATQQLHLSLTADGEVSGKSPQKSHMCVCLNSAVATGPSLPQWQQCSPQWSALWCTLRCHHSCKSTRYTWHSHEGPLRTTSPSVSLLHLGQVEKSQGSKGSSKVGLGV